MADLTLYSRWNEGSGSSAGQFKGLVDEFRLYKTALTPDGVRGLMWFLKGSNSLVVPRGLFYDSLLFKQMSSASSADIMSGPLAGANVHANTNNLSSNLNSRVIQLVIDKNLTLADAYPFLATEEFYTLGFTWEVTKLVANTSVANSGNTTASPPAPPPSNWWDAVWNMIAGTFAYIWNAVQAVLVFFSNAVKWLANVFIGLTIGLATGNWDYFEKNVVEPFKKALEAFFKFIIDFLSAAINWLFSPLIQAYNDM